MRSFTALLASASLLVVSTLAVPNTAWQGGSYGGWGKNKSPSWNPGRDSKCLSDSEAQAVADNFKESIAAYSDALADAAFTTDFQDYSDSVIELIDNGCPNSPVALGTATFDSLASFKAGQGAQPPIPFEILNIWHNCDTITIRWVSAQTPAQVTGIIVIEAAYENDRWMIETVFSEFNSGAWLVNLGIFKPSSCTA
ncbi:Ecp58-1 [Fulvia fulva]|uniref:Ecp58-1 n=1 Tax=Passalora fulva TaxID=5499 RepID=A0A1P8YXX9_PASFU|nr:Ecp58-1 [Fulvia fulva]AQA29297.1 extracellular protein 58-1 [Fulvia fulva]KAK4636273.1 Ecp58-1 [Fulvia fulva]KAK4637242.1 Ecp58-1 [Fulvia fulva]UJO12458.1 Ecp58-1 [Fulvia fulva]WPV08743.1 Ecp58-1 [Fulvia fulva]